MMISKKLITVMGAGLLLAGAPTQAQFTLLHSFASGFRDGAKPVSSLTLAGNTLYGMTAVGLNNQVGMLFSVGADGSGYTILTNGLGFSYIKGSLQLSGSSLYGVSGNNNLFRVNSDGTGFTNLFRFSNNGPVDTLTLSGSTFYGLTDNNDAIFTVKTDGTGFTTLYSFGVNYFGDGGNPVGSPVLVGSTLYGMCRSGGTFGGGTIFKINTDGTGYTILHNFNNEGNPFGSLLLSGTTLYGVTVTVYHDRIANKLFKINNDGSGYAILYSFPPNFQSDTVKYLAGDLTLHGTTLYGITYRDGGGFDTVFAINTSGSGFTTLHNFAGAPSDGNTPVGSPVLSSTALFGLTSGGGANSFGAVFSFPISSTSTSGAAAGCLPTTQPAQHSLDITRTALYWFTHGYTNDSVCASATLEKAITVNGGSLNLGFLCLPTAIYTSNGDPALSAFMEALGFYYKATGTTGDKQTASALCQARKKLAPELIAAIANNVLLGTGPGNASYNNGGVLTSFPDDLIDQAGQAAAGSDVAQIQLMTALLHKFNGSGVTNDFIYGVECSPNSRAFLNKIARDPTTFLNCPGLNSSCQTAEIVVLPNSDNPFATANYKRSVDTRKFAGICANINTNSSSGTSNTNGIEYVCFGGSGYWAIPPSLGTANRRFTITTAKSNFPVNLTVSKGDCAKLVSVVTVSASSSSSSYYPVKAQFNTDGINTFYIQAGSYTTAGDVQVSTGIYGKLNLTITSP